MTRILVITPTEQEKSSIFAALSAEESLRVDAVSREAEKVLGKIARSAPEVIVLELEAVSTGTTEFIRSILNILPVPVIVTVRSALESTEKQLKDAGAVAVLDSSVGGSSQLPRYIRIMKGMKIIRPRVARAPAKNGGKYLLIGASSGGPSVIRTLLAGIQPDTGLSVVLAQHLSAENLPAFRDWLCKETPWRLTVCKQPTSVRPGEVYLAPGGSHLIWSQGRLSSLPPGQELEFVPSANRLFTSFATCVADQVIALVLSGMGDDGAEGLAKLRAAGALTLAQAPEDAKVSGMPNSAIAAGAVQHVVRENRLVPVILSHLGVRNSSQP